MSAAEIHPNDVIGEPDESMENVADVADLTLVNEDVLGDPDDDLGLGDPGDIVPDEADVAGKVEEPGAPAPTEEEPPAEAPPAGDGDGEGEGELDLEALVNEHFGLSNEEPAAAPAQPNLRDEIRAALTEMGLAPQGQQPAQPQVQQVPPPPVAQQAPPAQVDGEALSAEAQKQVAAVLGPLPEQNYDPDGHERWMGAYRRAFGQLHGQAQLEASQAQAVTQAQQHLNPVYEQLFKMQASEAVRTVIPTLDQSLHGQVRDEVFSEMLRQQKAELTPTEIQRIGSRVETQAKREQAGALLRALRTDEGLQAVFAEALMKRRQETKRPGLGRGGGSKAASDGQKRQKAGPAALTPEALEKQIQSALRGG